MLYLYISVLIINYILFYISKKNHSILKNNNIEKSLINNYIYINIYIYKMIL